MASTIAPWSARPCPAMSSAAPWPTEENSTGVPMTLTVSGGFAIRPVDNADMRAHEDVRFLSRGPGYGPSVSPPARRFSCWHSRTRLRNTRG
jgi:hypothetical protein